MFTLFFAREILSMNGVAACKAVLLPFVVYACNKGFYLFFVVGGDAGTGVADQVCQRAIIRRNAEDGLVAAERFVEFGCQHSVRLRGGENQHDTTAPNSLTQPVMLNRVALRRVDVQNYRQSRFLNRLLDDVKSRFLPIEETADITDFEYIRRRVFREELLAVKAIVDNVHLGIEAANEIGMPRRDCGEGICAA